ncbi:DDE-type integrase/transposase/recombinase [Micromonospora sp. ATCC 39149]|nr:DDE-type integrase/transposase/recombinase [Micromonospora sp. ATCC 39149]
MLWCGDMTEIVTDQGKLYLATVIDLFSRRLLGYAMSEYHDAALIVASLNMAAATRCGTVDGVIFHSDRGGRQRGLRDRLPASGRAAVHGPGRLCAGQRRRGILNSTIKVEYIHRHRFTTRVEARLKISTWIVDFYNLRRRHSTCDGMSPIDYGHFMVEAKRTEAA